MVNLLRALTLPPVILTLTLTFAPVFVVRFAWYQQLTDFLYVSSVGYVLDHKGQELYDFIVVGGGSSGAVVASRLAEDYSVLLLEAGGDPHPLSLIPMANPLLIGQPIVDWEYFTEPLNNSGYAYLNQRMPYPRGRGLGGCSNNNYMQYNRGNPNDYDTWANITGDDRWNYYNVLKYFRRFEDYHGHWKDTVGDPGLPVLPEQFHGRGGPMNIEGIKFDPALKHWLAAAEELGYPTTLDPNSVQTQSFGPFDVFQKRGTRFSTYRGYLLPSLMNNKLTIRKYAYATKINFDENMRAIGVHYLHHGTPKYAAASNEIIISGGAINSPQLLMLSGIGETQHLLQVGIKPLLNLPVGRNLQDHVSALAFFHMDSPISFMVNRDASVASLFEYIAKGTGPLSGVPTLGGSGFISTQRAPLDWPDIFYMLIPTGNYRDYGVMQDLVGSYSTNLFEKWMKPTEGTDGHLVYVLLGKPKSRGYVKLADADPMSKPLIQPAYFSDANDEDIETLIDGLEFLVKMYEHTKAFEVTGARMNPIPIPGCENYIFKSRRYFECLIRTLPQTTFHPASTCPMGKVGDPQAVVDSELRVIGTTSLRVADTSIMPVITNANLNGPAIMIGERCADLIKSTWVPSTTLPPAIEIERGEEAAAAA